VKPEQVKLFVGRLPYMKLSDARIFYELIVANELHRVLELGFLHGVSTAYLAGAVEDAGEQGSVTTIDLLTAQKRKPNIEEVLRRTGLRDRVEIFYEEKTFNWRLMRFLEETPPRTYDLIYIDAAHTWVDTGFAFYLATLLLRPGGWVVFDDLEHTYRTSSNRDKDWVRRMPEEEQTVPQVERVFSLLVMRDRNFDTFRKKAGFGFARKRPAKMPGTAESLCVELAVCQAAARAEVDGEWRNRLLREPAPALAEISGEPVELFAHVRFLESPSWAPEEPHLSANGLLTHMLERPVAEWTGEPAVAR
jgi:predicted O-methyltransferase YrrM